MASGTEGPETARSSEKFPKQLRVLKRRDFLHIQDKGAKVAVGPLLALAVRNGKDVTRMGLTVSTKVGIAVVRVRLRRQLRELFRKRRAQLPPGIDLVIVARASAAQSDYEALSRAFDQIARKLKGMFPPP